MSPHPQPPSAQSPRSLDARRIAVFQSASLGETFVQTLLDLGAETVTLVGSAPAGVTPADPRVRLRPDMPRTSLEMDACLEGIDFAVATLVGPILGQRWLEQLNERAFARSLPWLRCGAMDGSELLVGPLFEPRVEGCHACFETRYRTNMFDPTTYARFDAVHRDGVGFPELGLPPSVYGILAALVLERIGAFFDSRRETPKLAELHVMSLRTFDISVHPLLPLPFCSVCSPDAPAAAALPVELDCP